MWGSNRAACFGVALLALVLGAMVAACGGGEDGVSSNGDRSADTPLAQASLFERLLGTIPDTPKTRESVIINDYAAIRELLEVALPGPDAGQPAMEEYLKAILIPTNMPRSPFFDFGRDAPWQPKREYVAFDARNVDQSVEAGIVPQLLEVAWGRFDPEATAQALASCSECPPPDMETQSGVPFYSWGADFAGNISDRGQPPLFDQFGRGGRLAVSSGWVYRTIETPGMRALIDSGGGNGQTLADVPEFRLLGAAMSSLGAYAAIFTDQTHRISAAAAGETPLFNHLPGVHEKLIGEIGNSTLLLPYQTFAAGQGRDDTGRYMALALVHADAGQAEENAQRLRTRITDSQAYPELKDWRDRLEDFSIVQEGRVLLVTVRGDGLASGWMSMPYQLIPLIPHE